MNDNTRPSRSIPHRSHPVPGRQPTSHAARREALDRPGAVEDPFVPRGSLWLDRLALAVTAGLTIAAPRSALLAADLLGPSRPAQPRTARDPRLDA